MYVRNGKTALMDWAVVDLLGTAKTFTAILRDLCPLLSCFDGLTCFTQCLEDERLNRKDLI